MEKWFNDAKNKARKEAEYFIWEMNNIAEENDIEPDWFLEEVVKNIHKLKGKQ